MMPPIVRRSDTVDLISPIDPSIDHDSITDLDGWRDYTRGERDALGFDVPVKPDSKPTIFRIRALTSREKDVALSLTTSAMSSGEDHEPDREETILASTAYLGYCIRFALVKVENWEGWTWKRERKFGIPLWPESILDAIDPVTFGFLSLAIHNLSTVPLVSAEPST